MKGLLPRVLYKREKVAFMAPPAHTDEVKFNAVKNLAATYLSKKAIEEAGVLDHAGILKLFSLHEHPETEHSTLVQLDATINHALGIQVLHRSLIAADIPKLARSQSNELGWSARPHHEPAHA